MIRPSDPSFFRHFVDHAVLYRLLRWMDIFRYPTEFFLGPAEPSSDYFASLFLEIYFFQKNRRSMDEKKNTKLVQWPHDNGYTTATKSICGQMRVSFGKLGVSAN